MLILANLPHLAVQLNLSSQLSHLLTQVKTHVLGTLLGLLLLEAVFDGDDVLEIFGLSDIVEHVEETDLG